MISCEILIVGAGPAGVACALKLAEAGKKVYLLDKAKFPRDKICGDALSADVMNQLHQLPLGQPFEQAALVPKTACQGVTMVAPNGTPLNIPFHAPAGRPADTGYICRRTDFDNWLLQSVREQPLIRLHEEERVTRISRNDQGWEVETTNNQYATPMLIGADGANSVVARAIQQRQVNPHHYCAGLRRYYENVSGFTPGKPYIELHFMNQLLPGYFWIFPLPGNRANVGLGMLSSAINRKKVNLKTEMENIIASHPAIAPRFAGARALESVQGFGLPIGSKKRILSGDHYLLLGDAAGLIDPFSGEGIGNAIRSGRVAADHILKGNKTSASFSAGYNKAYDKEIYRRMGHELQLSRKMQLLLNYPRLFNFIAGKASRNPSLQVLLTSMLSNVDVKQLLLRPSFYFRLLFT